MTEHTRTPAFVRHLVFSICWLCTVNAPQTLGKAHSPDHLEVIDITKEPRPEDWRAFLRAENDVRAKLWRYHEQRGKTLGSWSWMWRLGWVRSCAESKERYCLRLLFGALFDKALVVRADAAIKIGRRFEASGRQDVIDILAKAGKNPKNRRSGKSLYIQQRILFAMMQVGGSSAMKAARTVASTSASDVAYLERISRR